MDYLAIFPLIAGTFTPLCLVFYHTDPIGWAFCCTVWFVAVAGMIITVVCFVREIVVPKWLTMTLYITLGWFGACMTYWLLPVLSLSGFLLFLFGGIAYTVGGYIYSVRWKRLTTSRTKTNDYILLIRFCLLITVGTTQSHSRKVWLS